MGQSLMTWHQLSQDTVEWIYTEQMTSRALRLVLPRLVKQSYTPLSCRTRSCWRNRKTFEDSRSLNDCAPCPRLWNDGQEKQASVGDGDDGGVRSGGVSGSEVQGKLLLVWLLVWLLVAVGVASVVVASSAVLTKN